MLKVLPRSLSDHNVLLLIVDETNWGPGPFKFFNHWTDDNGFKELVHSSWMKFQNNGVASTNLCDKFKALKIVIKEWYQQEGVDDPFKISNLEEDTDRDEKHLLVDSNDVSIRESLGKKNSIMVSL